DTRHRDTQVVESSLAVIALAAEQQRHHRNTLPNSNIRYTSADLDDLGGEFVAEDLRQPRLVERVRFGWDDDGPHRVLVQVGSANAAPAGPQQHLARARFARSRNVFDADVVVTVENRRLHRELLCDRWQIKVRAVGQPATSAGSNSTLPSSRPVA